MDILAPLPRSPTPIEDRCYSLLSMLYYIIETNSQGLFEDASRQVKTLQTTLIKLQRGELLNATEAKELGLNREQLATLMYPGLVFDVALPQMWLNNWNGMAYQTVMSGTVWAYPETVDTSDPDNIRAVRNVYGLPFALTEEAAHLIKAME